eukprot:1170598-Prorocentrum_minimum.AAC.2
MLSRLTIPGDGRRYWSLYPLGLDAVTVELTVKSLSTHLVTLERIQFSHQILYRRQMSTLSPTPHPFSFSR